MRCDAMSFTAVSTPSFASLGLGTYMKIKFGAGFKLENKNGPFSAVSTPPIASVGTFFSLFSKSTKRIQFCNTPNFGKFSYFCMVLTDFPEFCKFDLY